MLSCATFLLIAPVLGGLFSPCTSEGCVDHALDLTADDMLKVSEGTTVIWIVVFYASWCPHCKRYAPEFKRLAGNYAGLESTIKFGGFDCAENSECSEQYDVNSYPTVKIFSKITGGVSRTAKDPEFHGTKVNVKSEEELMAHIKTALHVNANAGSLGKATNAGTKVVLPSQSDRDWSSNLLYATRRDHYWDAYTAVFESMKNSLFLKATVDGLPEKIWRAAKDYVRYAANNFPNSELQNNLRDFTVFLSDRKPRSETEFRNDLSTRFSGVTQGMTYRSCQTYTCGQWTLFHLLAQQVEEARLPRQAFYRFLENFADNFFGCAECRDHFKEMLKRDEQVRVSMPANEWLWKAHNEATARIYKGNRKPWPPASICPLCWESTGDADMTQIRIFLHHSFQEDRTATFGNVHDTAGVTMFFVPVSISIVMLTLLMIFFACSSTRTRAHIVNKALGCWRFGRKRYRNSEQSSSKDSGGGSVPTMPLWLNANEALDNSQCPPSSPAVRLAKFLHVFSLENNIEEDPSGRHRSSAQRQTSEHV